MEDQQGLYGKGILRARPLLWSREWVEDLIWWQIRDENHRMAMRVSRCHRDSDGGLGLGPKSVKDGGEEEEKNKHRVQWW